MFYEVEFNRLIVGSPAKGAEDILHLHLLTCISFDVIFLSVDHKNLPWSAMRSFPVLVKETYNKVVEGAIHIIPVLYKVWDQLINLTNLAERKVGKSQKRFIVEFIQQWRWLMQERRLDMHKTLQGMDQ